jgi:hypothetical protein
VAINKCTDSIRIAIMFKNINSYIGHQWPIMRDRTTAWNEHLTFLSSPVCSRTINEISTVQLRAGNDRKVDWLFYSTVHSMMMGYWGPKHVGVDVVKHYCNWNELCVFVDLCCKNWIIMKNVRTVASGWL